MRLLNMFDFNKRLDSNKLIGPDLEFQEDKCLSMGSFSVYGCDT